MSNVARSFTRPVESRQRLVHIIASRVDGTGTASLLSGGQELTLTDAGTGHYSLAINQPYGQVPVVQVTPVTAGIHVQIFSVSVSTIVIKTFAVDGTTATDADFHVLIIGSDAPDAV